MVSHCHCKAQIIYYLLFRGGTPPSTQVVSLKELMAAEAAAAAAVVEAQTNRKKPPPPPLIVQPMLQRSMSYEEVLNVRLVVSLSLPFFLPFSSSHYFNLYFRSKDASPTVSFADIVNDQLREMNQLSRQ